MTQDIIFTPLGQHMIVEIACEEGIADDEVREAVGATGEPVSVLRSPDGKFALIVEWS